MSTNGTNDASVVPVATDPGQVPVAATPVQPVATPPVVTSDPVAERLLVLQVPADKIALIKQHLVDSVDDLAFITVAQLTDKSTVAMKAGPAGRLVDALKVPSASVAVVPAVAVDPNAEIPEDTKPSEAQVQGFAGALGLDPMSMMLFMNGMGGDMDFSGLIPIPTMVQGYNPKLRNMFLMVLGQVEAQLGVPIIVIDENGAVNKPLTIQYIEGIQEGFDPAPDNIYFDAAGEPHEVVRVGVDAQSVYDADPIEPTRALQKNGMGIGRVNWSGVSLEVRQVAYHAVVTTHEIDPKNDTHLAWLRDHIKGAATKRLVFQGQAPKAIGAYNDAFRTGSNPTLRVTLSRGPRRIEIMPRRRRQNPRDLTGIGPLRDGRRVEDDQL